MINIEQIKQLYDKSDVVIQVSQSFDVGLQKLNISGAVGSVRAFLISALFSLVNKPISIILPTKEDAAYLLNEMEILIKDAKVLFLPSSYRTPGSIDRIDNNYISKRIEVLNVVNRSKKDYIIVSYADAIYEKVITKKHLNKSSFSISVGKNYSIEKIVDILTNYDFDHVNFVSEPGEFSVRGSILDIFSYGNDTPYRVDFFDEEVESIRLFDIESQCSIEKVEEIHIVSEITHKDKQIERIHLLEYFKENTLVFTVDLAQSISRIDDNYKKIPNDYKSIFSNATEFYEQLNNFKMLEFGKPYLNSQKTFKLSCQPQPAFNKKYDLLNQDFYQNKNKGFKNILFCSDQKQVNRLKDILQNMQPLTSFDTVLFPLHEGFVDIHHKLVCYTDHQIFERYQKFTLRNNSTKKQALTLKEINTLKVGDYITHIDHGIGKFVGLQKVEINGKFQEVIKLIYKNNDLLFVGIHALHKISKYTVKEGSLVKISKLGSASWKTIKNKAKKKIKEIAFDLIKLYAKRKEQKGFEFSPDTYLQHELEASFLYEETPDQLSTLSAVKEDMENEQPMDRLVCGDVGFGKTEIAIRAAFKAVVDSKQVAILVPTTILAYQHYQTFTKRLKDLPCRVEYISRFKSAKQKKEILKDLQEGKIDIIIGTHQLTNDSFKYKDLGLLIVDEEQKFGVGIKDKLKVLKSNIDTLTFTATPIPRTLQFSLMAARDLSIINTPPPNRHPIESSVITFDKDIIKNAIEHEMARGGQVFFINNRISNIKEIADMIKRLVPLSRVKFEHGQINGNELEKTTLDFINGEFDVLVSTTIIENGLDVPNANTIFINDAQNFGLSDLHQMRGRVGRSNKKAFCYLITPPYFAMTENAKKRLKALEEFSDLGSGFKIAMKDLEIRGAGDLLGAKQSGFISDIGFDTYQKILNEAIEELKEEEFKELYKNTKQDKLIEFSKDCSVETDFEILIPQTYVGSVSERLNLYSRLNQIKNEQELNKFQIELKDRFGKIPIQTKDLITSVLVKWKAKRLGFEKIVMKQGDMRGYFIGGKHNTFFESETFTKVLNYVQQHPTDCKIEQRQINEEIKLILIFNDISNVDKSLKTLQKIV